VNLIAKEGLGIILGVLVLSLVTAFCGFYFDFLSLNIASTVLAFLFVCCLFFFRDPDRQIPAANNVIVAAADGKIVAIKDVNDDKFLKGPATQVSIFLSVFNVHVNRIPMSGVVRYFEYSTGRFLAAFNHRASTENEQTIVGIENGSTRIIVKQIAGLIARRIICKVKEGDSVRRGDRFGLIKFGSRVDYLLPKNTEVTVKLGQKVKGGESVIAKILMPETTTVADQQEVREEA